MEILILCGIYVVQALCCWLGLKLLFDVKWKHRKLIVLGMLFPVIIGLLPLNSARGNEVLVSLSVLCLVFVSMDGTLVEKGAKLILVFLLLECVNVIFMRPCEKILYFVDSQYKENLVYIADKCCVIMIVLSYYFVRKRLRRYGKVHINSSIYVIIGVIASSMMFCIAILDYVTVFVNNRIFIMFCNILIAIIFISIFLLTVFVMYIKNTHERMEQLLRTEQTLKESQVSYYKQMLRQETDTKRYRHDMMNHLNLLLTKLVRNDTESARLYLEHILGGFRKIQYTHYTLGNEMVDTIMNYFFGLLPEHTAIMIETKFPVEFDMVDTDICTVFSNLFQNMVEELADHKDENATIIIRGERGKSYAKYLMKNTLFSEVGKTTKEGLPMSHKEDSRSHGIGMLNVKETIEKNDGKFTWYQKDGYFCIDLVLKLKDKTE